MIQRLALVLPGVQRWQLHETRAEDHNGCSQILGDSNRCAITDEQVEHVEQGRQGLTSAACQSPCSEACGPYCDETERDTVIPERCVVTVRFAQELREHELASGFVSATRQVK